MRHHLTGIARRLWRQKGLTAMNVAGLGVGLAVSAFMLLYIRYELSYDRFHEEADRLYRVSVDIHVSGRVVPSARLPVPFITSLNEIPDIDRLVEMKPPAQALIEHDDDRFYQDGVAVAGPDFFSVFGFDLVEGDPASVLDEPWSVVVSRAVASKLFGDEAALGRKVRLDGETYTVTGVFDQPDDPSHLAFDVLTSWITIPTRYRSKADLMFNNWGIPGLAYIRLFDGIEPSGVERKLETLIASLNPDPATQRYDVHLESVRRLHLHSRTDAEFSAAGSSVMLAAFGTIAILILAIACINYVNLATAQSTRRIREFGIRKVVGAEHGQIFRQIMGEAVVTSMFALILAILLLEATMPFAERLTGRPIAATFRLDGLLLPGMFCLAVATGLLSGTLPAFLFAATGPCDAIRRQASLTGSRSGIRRTLVVAQFTIAIVFLAGSFVIRDQLEFARTSDLGFEKERIISLPVREPIEYYRRSDTIKEQLRLISGVESVTGSLGRPGIWSPESSFRADGLTDTSAVVFRWIAVDFDFARTFGLKVTEGRAFDARRSTDSTAAFLINEAARRVLGLESAVGKFIEPGVNRRSGTIIGVVEDFQLASLHEPMQPVLMYVMPPYFSEYVHIRIAAGDPGSSLRAIKDVWTTHFPSRPFEYAFYDDVYDEQYARERHQARIAVISAMLAFFIACVGLFGMAAFSARERTYEIGLRKALGASTTSILVLLTTEFLRLIVFALALATPVSVIVAHRWLSGFAFHVSVGMQHVIPAAVVAIVVAVVTISGHTIRAALANPVESLRSE